MDSTAITCSTPSLETTSLTPLNYALVVDDAPPTTQARLPITVQSDPSNFKLEGSQEVTSGIETIIRIVVGPIASTLTCVYTDLYSSGIDKLLLLMLYTAWPY